MKSRRRIAFCVRDMQVGGVEIALLRTIDALRRRGNVDICVITYVPICVKQFQQWFAARPDIQMYTLYPCKWLGTKLVRFFPVRLIHHALRDLYRGMGRWCLRASKFGDIDVFVDYYNFQFVPEFRRIRGTKIAWWHSSINVLWRENVARYVDEYDQLILLTDEARDEFCARMPHLADRVRRIYNPVEVHEIKALAAVGQTGAGDYFCAVSRLAGDKDIPTILTAFDLFWRNAGCPDVNLILVGDGHLVGALQARAATLAARDHIIFTGAVANPFGYMQGARAHILSSYGEGMGIVLIEATAAGTINIASDCKNGPREILIDGAAGILFASGDVAALANAMMDVWMERVNTAAMRRRATDGLKRFDAAQIANQIMAMITQIN